MSVVIKAENLSKAYQLGQIGTGTISRDIERWFVTKLLRKQDPFLKVGETNDRTVKGKSDIVWSLKDINFEICQGDAVGIIGKNGAGKSTLLKLLSRVTAPTTGKIKLKGRVASLLEVGTGFHPELTGRENIYLNGSILGMRKREIDRKLDEIVDFSGIERYIDTPVKRYSSGMYVRLAFAVAAHLESEILIVDEVLAVGDAEFQKKCLGKMGDVSLKEGRTILFVSHNLAAIKSLCRKGVLLTNGEVEVVSNSINKVVEQYTKPISNGQGPKSIEKLGLVIDEIFFEPGSKRVQLGENIKLGFRIKNNTNLAKDIKFNLELKNEYDEPVYCVGNEFNEFPLILSEGDYIRVIILVNDVNLRPGLYKVFFYCQSLGAGTIFDDYVSRWSFSVETSDYLESGGKLPMRHRHGLVIKKYVTKKLDQAAKTYLLEV